MAQGLGHDLAMTKVMTSRLAQALISVTLTPPAE